MNARLVGVVAGVGTVAAIGLLNAVMLADQPGLAVVDTLVLGGLLGLAVGLLAWRFARAAAGRDRAERVLSLATAGLPASRREWSDAMHAELAAIEDDRERRRFARSAAGAALGQGPRLIVEIAVVVGVVAAIIALAASRNQLTDSGPGIFGTTALGPTPLILLVAALTAAAARSFRVGVLAGLAALAASLLAVWVVVAVEGLVWMEVHGVFVLDGDPPKRPVNDLDVMLDMVTNIFVVFHVMFWIVWPFVGAGLGVGLALWSDSRRLRRTSRAAA